MARAAVSLSRVKREIDAATKQLRAHARAAGNTASDTRKLDLKIRKLEAISTRVDLLCKRQLDLWPEKQK